MVKPYEEHKDGNVLFRRFAANTDSDELVWHQDNEDRIIAVIKSGGWQLQLDNQLPTYLNIGDEITIPAGLWHRVLRGSSELFISITI